jgi:hypothetical protein
MKKGGRDARDLPLSSPVSEWVSQFLKLGLVWIAVYMAESQLVL